MSSLVPYQARVLEAEDGLTCDRVHSLEGLWRSTHSYIPSVYNSIYSLVSLYSFVIWYTHNSRTVLRIHTLEQGRVEVFVDLDDLSLR